MAFGDCAFGIGRGCPNRYLTSQCVNRSLARFTNSVAVQQGSKWRYCPRVANPRECFACRLNHIATTFSNKPNERINSARVTELSESEATLDGNHPFAGHTVEVRCAVLEVRPATEDEIEHGHAHGSHEDHAH